MARRGLDWYWESALGDQAPDSRSRNSGDLGRANLSLLKRTTKLPEGVKLDGIRYRSSRRDGGISLVLFADRRNVEGASGDTWPKPDPWLELVGRSERVVA